MSKLALLIQSKNLFAFYVCIALHWRFGFFPPWAIGLSKDSPFKFFPCFLWELEALCDYVSFFLFNWLNITTYAVNTFQGWHL